MDKVIMVAGYKGFPESRWREAILYFVFEKLKGNRIIERCPEISFGRIVLGFDEKKKKYFVRNTNKNEDEVPNIFGSESVIYMENPEECEVEIKLLKFVKDSKIRVISIFTSKGCWITLWKKHEKGEYGLSGLSLPHKLGHIWHG